MKDRYEMALNYLLQATVPTHRTVNERKKEYDILNVLVERAKQKTERSYIDGNGDSSIPGGSESWTVNYCPCCESEIENYEVQPNYCSWCGQALRWPEDE